MPTTAGSLALQDNLANRDSPLVARLRAAGAIILGKTNCSEWANFRSSHSTSGWSGRGGQTRNPYALDRNPCGSSSGTGAAISANLAMVGVGTETDGSVVCPSTANGLVGLKPTVGLVSRSGIIPISASQDTAGPMTRDVRDAAILLNAMIGIDPADAATASVPDGGAAGFAAAEKSLEGKLRVIDQGNLGGSGGYARGQLETVKAGEGRTRAALYHALSLAYDFAIAADQSPEEYAELLEESGVKAQTRAPMTPIVKLVFGIDYDKARLTEFAAALSFGRRQDLELGGFQAFIEKQPGGLKALVAAERAARRPEPKADTKSEAARARLRAAPALSLADVPTADEFALVLTRRGADGTHEPIALVDDEALVERAIRRTI